MNLLDFRRTLHDILGFRFGLPTATDEQIVEEVLAVVKRADDAEQELAKVHEALDEAGVPAKHPEPVVGAGVAIAAADRVRLLSAVVSLDERKEASNLATLCQDAHDALTAAGLPECGTHADRIRALAAQRDEARSVAKAEVDRTREALDAAGVPNKVNGLRLTAAERIRHLAAERDTLRNNPADPNPRDAIDDAHSALDAAEAPHVGDLAARIKALARMRYEADGHAGRCAAESSSLRAELDAYRSRGLPPAEAPKPATRDTTALRELLDGLEADAVRAHHPVSAASVRAVRVLVGVSDG